MSAKLPPSTEADQLCGFVAPGRLSRLELDWAIPAKRVFHEALSSARTLVRMTARAASDKLICISRCTMAVVEL